MFKFDWTQLRVEHIRLKMCTTALGGSISIVDEQRSTDSKEVYKRIPIPYGVARSFIKTYGISKYLNAVEAVILYYGDQAVCVERHRLAGLGTREEENLDGELVKWVSNCEKCVDLIANDVCMGEWYTDGQFIYKFADAIDNCVRSAIALTADYRFRSVVVDCIDMTKFAGFQTEKHVLKFGHIRDVSVFCKIEQRACYAFVASNGQYAITPPIKKSTTIGISKMKRLEDDDAIVSAVDANVDYDTLDRQLSVNMAFALYAGQALSEVNGYDSIFPLGIEDLMVRFKTVNLLTVPKSVRCTTSIDMTFLQTLAWVIGHFNKTETFTQYQRVKAVLKNLVTVGLFKTSSMKNGSIFHKGQSADTIPAMCINELHEALKSKGAMSIIENMIRRRTDEGESTESIMRDVVTLL